MRKQGEAIERKLAEKDIEITKLMEEKKISKPCDISVMEQRISFLSEKLISKQTAIERIESEKRALELRLERAEVIFLFFLNFIVLWCSKLNRIKRSSVHFYLTL